MVSKMQHWALIQDNFCLLRLFYFHNFGIFIRMLEPNYPWESPVKFVPMGQGLCENGCSWTAVAGCLILPGIGLSTRERPMTEQTYNGQGLFATGVYRPKILLISSDASWRNIQPFRACNAWFGIFMSPASHAPSAHVHSMIKRGQTIQPVRLDSASVGVHIDFRLIRPRSSWLEGRTHNPTIRNKAAPSKASPFQPVDGSKSSLHAPIVLL